MLIPNVHLETPNYTVTRMRHDDLNKTEPLAPSYHLVEAPTEEEKKTQSKASEAAPPRPEAAVRGITPQQPAPIPVARETRPEQPRQQPAPAGTGDASIIGKIFGFFKRKPEAPKPAGDVPQSTPERGQRRGGREQERPRQQGGQRHRQDSNQQDRQRDGGRHRQGQNRQERPGEPRPDSRRNEHNQGQRQQQQRPPQPPRDPAQPDAGRPAQGQQPPREQGEQREGQGRGRRRRRGGRDRNEQRQGEGGGQQSNRPQQAPREHQRPAEGFPVASLADAERAHHAAATEVPEPVEHVSPPAYEAPAAPAPYERETVREFQPREPVVPQPAPASGAGYAPAVPIKMEWPSDLQQVESDPVKVSVAQQEPVQQQQAPRPKRVRQPAPQMVDEPLVQIETDRADAQPGGSGEKTPA
jgi:ribonuclease E